MKAQTSELPPTVEEVVGTAVFKAEVEAWAKRIGVHPKETRLRPMKRKWASCSTHGRLTFNSEILREPARLRAEVSADSAGWQTSDSKFQIADSGFGPVRGVNRHQQSLKGKG